MQPISVTVGPIDAADSNCIAESQTVSGAANVVLNGTAVSGGVAILDVPRQIQITCAGNDSSITFTISGTTFNGLSVSETIQGVNGATNATNVDFKTVTSIKTSGSTSVSGIIVGTNSCAGSRWVRFDSWANAQTAIQCNVSGIANYSVQVTMDDPNDPITPVSVPNVTWLNTSDPDAVTALGDVFSNFDWTPTFARIILLSGSGTVTGTFAQFNAVNR